MNRRHFIKRSGLYVTGAIAFPNIIRAGSVPVARQSEFFNPPSPAAAAGGGCDSVNDASLQSWWRLEEASGPRSDTKGSNNLTDSGSTGNGTGKIGSAASFSGSTSLKHVSNASLATGNVSFSFGCWFKTTTLSSYQGIITKGGEYIAGINGDTGALFFETHNGSGAGGNMIANATLSTGTWFHVVMIYDATDLGGGFVTKNIYVNGALDKTAIADQNVAGTDAFEIGALDAGSDVWLMNGLIDEAFFTKKALTLLDVVNLYNSGSACRPSGV